MAILIFRITLLSLFLLAAWVHADWKNWQKYYPTILYATVESLTASYLTYHHTLWIFNPGAVVTTHTVVELINAFVVLPAVTFTFLSKYPFNERVVRQFVYVFFWVSIFAVAECIAHYIIGSIGYDHGWSWKVSVVFDIGLFTILRVHHTRPFWAWCLSVLVAIVIFLVFDFRSIDIK